MLDGRVVLVTGGGSGIGRQLALGLGDAGASVAVADGPIASRDEATRAFTAAAEAEARGPIDAVVHALVEPGGLVSAPLAETDASEWDQRGEAVVRTALWGVQGAYDVFGERGGRIVMMTPTVGLTGCSGLVPYATAIEGIRALAKSAARQWGERQIAVNCVAPPVELFGPTGGPAVAVPALGRLPDARGDVAPVVALLLAGPFVTGTTVVVDGGMVMAP